MGILNIIGFWIEKLRRAFEAFKIMGYATICDSATIAYNIIHQHFSTRLLLQITKKFFEDRQLNITLLPLIYIPSHSLVLSKLKCRLFYRKVSSKTTNLTGRPLCFDLSICKVIIASGNRTFDSGSWDYIKIGDLQMLEVLWFNLNFSKILRGHYILCLLFILSEFTFRA